MVFQKGEAHIQVLLNLTYLMITFY